MSGIPAGAGQLLGKRLGKFEILALLALGGTAEIYLARIGGAAGFEKYVVVKCLHDHLADDAEFVKMFLDEARLAAHLDHSNIVQTMELGQHDGRYYMVMEFLAGLSLAMIIRRAGERLPTGRLPVPLVLNVLAQSCAGLHYAHEKAMNGRALNIVHRDISPQNLVISFEGVVKVVDFGIAKAEMRETHTRSGTIKGKFAYMSPEQCVANNVDRRTDVFALGVIGHELLTGRRLFKRPSPYETYQAVIECEVKPPSAYEVDLDPAIDQVLMRALAKDKADRYPTAEAFGDALLGYLHHRGIGSGPGDVSRFFDAYFGQEIDEHSTRMRELISGREISMETGVTWGSDEVDEVRAAELRVAAAAAAAAGGGDDASRPGAPPGLAGLLDELGSGSRVEDDDEMPAERTRIESNPLDRISELDRVVSSAPPKRTNTKKLSKSDPGQAADKPGVRPPLPGMPPSGRFPDLANLPTMIAADAAPELAPTATGVPPVVVGQGPPGLPGGVPPAMSSFANLPTSKALGNVPAAVSSFANAPTGLAPQPSVPAAVSSFSNAPTALAPKHGAAAANFSNAPTSLAPGHAAPPSASSFSDVPTTLEPPPPPSNGARAQNLAPGVGPGAALGTAPGALAAAAAAVGHAVAGNGSPASQPWPPPLAPRPHMSSAAPPVQPPAGYPVMSAEMSAQIATGATVFPSETRGSGTIPRPGDPAMPPGPSDSYPALDGARPDPAAARPDPQRAANLMSPVGQQYPEQIDWAAAAASRARGVPTWFLIALFVGAIAVALILTIVFAKLIR